MNIYLFFIIVLFCLAIFGLIVGVSNDAINFLNSAIGSKVSRTHIILIIASIGILTGAILSNGMMEVARKGLFFPQYFLFTEIVIIFLAVMFTNVLLLDFFNTFGLPTSTTVSLVFGLLGAAIGMAYFKVENGAEIVVDGVKKVAEIGDFINSSKALVIISGILLSVAFSFVFGVIIQWLSRLLFSFNIEKTIRYYGAIWGGFAIAAITYFLLIKGLKDASFMTDNVYSVIQKNTLLIIFASFIIWSLILQLLSWFFKTNPLKIVVLAGTFALATAFAGNDLVNFIGVPLAGFEAYKTYLANNGSDLLMFNLLNDIKTPVYFLFGSGVIMAITLWFSKKARTVAETELKLSRQDEGSERFSSTAFSRYIVRRAVNASSIISKIVPQQLIVKIRERFDKTDFETSLKVQDDPPMFDLVRAAVNMMVASSLIAIGTSYKLPLSTTYVTFMVAMSTSLVDGAWGRDSAVYRITGVFTVIGGWFMTGLIAFTVALLISLFLGFAKLLGIIILLILSGFAFYGSFLTHKKRVSENQNLEKDEEEVSLASTLFEKCNNNISKSLHEVNGLYSKSIKLLLSEDHKGLKKQLEHSSDLLKKIDKKRNNSYQVLNTNVLTDSIEISHYYILILDYLKEIAHCVHLLIEPIYNHVDNTHKPLTDLQAEELNGLITEVDNYINMVVSSLSGNDNEKLDEIFKEQAKIIGMNKEARKNLIKSIKKNEIGKKNSLLFMTILGETRNILIYTSNMMRIQNDFAQSVKNL